MMNNDRALPSVLDHGDYRLKVCTAALGSRIGIGVRQTHRLLKEAQRLGYITVQQSFNSVAITVTNASLLERRADIQKYDLALATQLGATPAIIHMLLERTTRQTLGAYNGYDWVIKEYPWLTQSALLTAIFRLRRAGLIYFDNHNGYLPYKTSETELPPVTPMSTDQYTQACQLETQPAVQNTSLQGTSGIGS